MATKKAAAKKAAAKKTTKSTGDRDDKLMEQVVKLRESGKKWDEISEKLNLTPGRVIHLYDRATFPKSERITGDTEKELGQAIVRAREVDLMSWGKIANRANMGEARARNLYAKYSKNPEKGARIGKGGRYPGDVRPDGDAPAKTARAAKTTKGAAKAKGGGKPHPLEGKTLEEIREKLENRVVTTGRLTGEPGEVIVKKVKSLKDGVITVTNGDGKSQKLEIRDLKGSRELVDA